jgi:ABC-type transport system substrate-binding protein
MALRGQRFDRRVAMQGLAAGVAGLSGAALSSRRAFGASRFQAGPDAAPDAQQIRITSWQAEGMKAEAMDLYEGVYNRGGLSDLFSEPLTRMTKDFGVVPGAALGWDVDASGKVWTFHIDPALKWSDGTAVTAADYVETFRYSADPKHAWDFTWYWSGVIKNYTECTKGTATLDTLGVRVGSVPTDFVVETVDPVPYLPAQMLYSWPLNKVAMNRYGSGRYNTNVSTSITSGPYYLAEWSPDRRFVVKENPRYSGTIKPLIKQQIANVVRGGSDFLRYQANEIDDCEVTSPADITLINADPDLARQFFTNPQDFRTFYLFFDVNTKPWDNLKLRQALAKAVDRESIIEAILRPLAVPAYSFLAPGFPDANQDALKPAQAFDPEAAQRLLAEAGYPGGRGFPASTLYIRGSNQIDKDVCQAIAAGFKQILGLDIKLENLDQPSYMAKLNSKPTAIPFGWISYGMDYFDATNMLGVWLSGGRHSWKNDEFDRLVKVGGAMTTEPEKRSEMMKSAEKLLVDDCVGIFVYHQLHGYLYKPYLKGDILLPNSYGYTGLQWPGLGTATLALGSLYITNDVSKYRR